MLRKALGAFFVLTFVTVILNPITFVSASSTEGWVQMYGGNIAFYAEVFVQANDGGFLIAGWTDSGALLLKTDSSGNMEWNQTYGNIDHPKSLVEASDGGYALVNGNQLVKTDAYGNVEWKRTLLGGNTSRSLIQTSDGGYAIAGYSGDGSTSPPMDYFWLVKTDELGYNMWNKIYDTLVEGGAASLIQTLDGGYAMLGTHSHDFMLVKTDSSGELEWSKIYEKPDKNSGNCIIQNSDGGYTLSGLLWNRSATDHMAGLIKTDSNGTMLWMKNYPGNWHPKMVSAGDGGYVLFSVSMLTKTDSEGNIQWTQNLINLYTNWLIQTHDGGYAILGECAVPRTDDPSTRVINVCIIKTDPDGIVPEFPSWTILPLLLLATVAVIIYRKKLHRTQTQQSY
jgi:hypothetical protein